MVWPASNSDGHKPDRLANNVDSNTPRHSAYFVRFANSRQLRKRLHAYLSMKTL